MSCSKRSYSSEELALTALLEVRGRFENNQAVTVYQCEDCGLWHLTSKGNLHPALKRFLDTGQARKQLEAEYWERKLR
ncbi:hypothetical protein [Leadbetterella byssophila]|uniref:Uncharacterized protein n=1 Tax=Leadbetterella byssophila (strain DSM 17132 / JCM 16389 / KACC 11308 / NBRC 106382 / 4M15) TaxID=649349 RepID=E4RV69_LEAB4|nr:hypothetical protein [Leadbetterella byssophila]ADQ18807.1 hypothetical protein Lbys_3146 [Leadbetterella byssophila DSM 17132]